MTISIGINPISWSNDDLQYIGGDISLHTCLSEAAAAGYDGIELGHKFPRNAAELGPLLGEHSLSLVSGWYSGRLLERSSTAEIEAMTAHATLLAALNSKVLIFAEVSGCIHSNHAARMSTRPRITTADWKQFGQRLDEVGKAAADHGLKLCYHHHMGTVVQKRIDIDALLQETSENVFLLLDTGHALFAGADPVSLATEYADRIGHLHCKDVRRTIMQACINRDSSFLDAVLDGVFTVPGDGCIDFPGVIEALGASNYDGWAVVEAEQDPSIATPSKYARIGYENLQTYLGRR